MKNKLTILAVLFITAFANLMAAPATVAQLPADPNALPPTFIKGDMTIRFATRSGDEPKVGVTDKYTLSINVSNSSLFHGTIDALPYIRKTFGSSQDASITYAMDLDVVNPKNPSQTRNVGKLFGTAPISTKNIYSFSDGNAKVSVFGIGNAKSFDSAFRGTTVGKPPGGEEGGVLAKLKKEAISVTQMVQGKPVSVPITKYDKMEFQQHVMPAGPVQIYPEVEVNGTMIYDYGRSAWWFDGVSISYVVDGRRYQDKITGSIRWQEAADRATTGNGSYDFDVRVNEPATGEAAAFAGVSDENSFFTTDDSIPSLTGSMSYKDTLSGETVVGSTVKVDLKGNKLTKQQTMYLCKLLFLTAVVPFNAE